MVRSAYKTLMQWKAGSLRKPLLLQGARQTGKTWLLKEFGRKEYEQYLYFNFEETKGLASLFASDISAKSVISALSAYSGSVIYPGKTLVILDEIQACPQALTSLKYLCEETPDIHVAAAGSLLGVMVGKTASFPVGKVNFLALYPLNFMEFLQASGEETLHEMLLHKTTFDPVPDLIHEKLTGLLRTYLYLGGMPEVVSAFMDTKDYAAAREIQNTIIKSYERDFSKYSTPDQAMRNSEIWQSIPSQLARESKKFKYSDVRKGGRASQFESAIEWLRSAGLLYISTCTTTARLPLKGYLDHSRFKAYLLDCGLLGAMVGLPSRVLVQGDLLFAEYNGAFIENMAAGELARKSEGSLHYWLSDGVAEVDFLVQHENEILPLEVKSGRKRNVRGLRIFAEKYGSRRIYRASPRNFECRDDFANLPLYAIGAFPQLR